MGKVIKASDLGLRQSAEWFDFDWFKRLAEAQVPLDDICAWFSRGGVEVTPAMLDEEVKGALPWTPDAWTARDIFARAGRANLRVKQMELAEGNAQLSMWMGRQVLGQGTEGPREEAPEGVTIIVDL